MTFGLESIAGGFMWSTDVFRDVVYPYFDLSTDDESLKTDTTNGNYETFVDDLHVVVGVY